MKKNLQKLITMFQASLEEPWLWQRSSGGLEGFFSISEQKKLSLVYVRQRTL